MCVEVARLAPADGSALARFEPDGMVTALSGWSAAGGYGYDERTIRVRGHCVGAGLRDTPAGTDRLRTATGDAAAAARKMGWRSSVGAPITVQGHLWGALAVVSASSCAATARHRAAAGEVHEAGGDCHRQRRESRTTHSSCRRAGRAAARGHPGGAGQATSATSSRRSAPKSRVSYQQTRQPWCATGPTERSRRSAAGARSVAPSPSDCVSRSAAGQTQPGDP